MRVAVLQRFLPHYRLAFFDQLDGDLHEVGGALRVFFSYEMGKLRGKPAWARRVAAVRKDLQLGELEDSAVIAPGLMWHLVSYAPDVVVLEDLGGLPNSLIGAVYCRLLQKPYVVWGLGHVPQKKRSKLRRLLAPAIKFLYNGASGFICYSQHAAEVYRHYGKPTYVAPNSYLSRPDPGEIERTERAIAKRAGEQTYNVISIGTLRRQKRYDVLLTAIANARQPLTLHLIGDGPESAALKQLAAELGIGDRVRFHGAVYDRDAKAKLLASAQLGIIPGRGGLAIQEMMAYGVPVISGVADGTERDLIRDRENGYLLDGFPSAGQIVSTLEEFFSLSHMERVAFGRRALATVVSRSNIIVMADGFMRALKDALRS